MDYVFGTEGEIEVLKTKGRTHSELSGYRQIERTYPDQTVTDNFRIVRKLLSAEDEAGNCYDWYEIDHHYRVQDRSGPVAATTAITFVTLAESGGIDDTTAGEHADLFSPWAPNVAYAAGNLRQDEGKLWRCLQDHTSQEDWRPSETPALWKAAADPTEEWPEWSQPIGAADAYNQGDKVSHNGKHWTSDVGANVWEPGVYGWTEA